MDQTPRPAFPEPGGIRTVPTALRGLLSWTGRQVLVAVVATVLFGGFLGLATVLIPNSIFARDIPPVWWNYPVWVLTSVFSGMLVATYVRVPGTQPKAAAGATSARTERRSDRFGLFGGALAFFAVGCPVCNKLALLALGYSGAITWFAPVQPFLAIGALVLSGVALVWRLRGLVACPVPAREVSPTVEEFAR